MYVHSQIIPCLWLFCGLFFIPPFSTLFFHPFSPLILDKREKRAERREIPE